MARRHKTAINDVLEAFQEASDARLGIEEALLENYRLFRNIDTELQKRQQEGRSALFIPKTYSRVQTATYRIVNALLAERPYVYGYPRRVDDELAYLRAASMQTLIDFQLAEIMRFRVTLEKAVRTALIYGYCPAQIGWSKKTRKRRRRLRNDEGVIIDQKTGEEIVYNAPVVKLIDPLGFFWDPFAETLDECDFVVVQKFVTDRWILDHKDIFENTNKAVQTVLPEGLPNWLQAKRQIMGWSDSRFERLNEILEMWTPDGVTTICNRQVVLRDLEENPYDHGQLPFAVAVDVPLLGEFVGLGMVGPMKDLQIELNAKRNQRIDNVNLILNKVFTVRKDSDLTEEDLRLYAGKIIPVDDHDEIQELEFDDVTASSYNEETIVNRDIDETTNIYPYMQGAPPQLSRERATTVVALQAAGDEPLRSRVALWEQMFLLPIVRQMSDLNQQFLGPEEFLRVVGEDGLTHFIRVNAKNFEGDFDFAWAGSTVDNVADRQFKVNQMIQLLGIVNQAQGVAVDRNAMIREILKLSQIRNVNQIVPPVSPILPQVQQAQPVPPELAMLAAAGMGAAPVPDIATPPNQDLLGAGRTVRIGPTPAESPVL